MWKLKQQRKWAQERRERVQRWEMDKSSSTKPKLWASIFMGIQCARAEMNPHAHKWPMHVKHQTLFYVELHWMGSRLEMMYLFVALSTNLLFAHWRGHCYRTHKMWLFNIVTHCSHVVFGATILKDDLLFDCMAFTHQTKLLSRFLFFLSIFFWSFISGSRMRIQWIDTFTHWAHEFCHSIRLASYFNRILTLRSREIPISNDFVEVFVRYFDCDK